MAELKEMLKKVIKAVKKAPPVEPEGARRIRQVQEAARLASEAIEEERE